MKLYLYVTDDEYELPMFVADTQQELAEYKGVGINTVQALLSKQRHGKIKSRCKEVVIDDND